MYGGIVFVWIFLTLFYTIGTYVHTDIVQGICMPYGTRSSYNLYFAVVSILVEYLLPLIMMLFCYIRIVYKITHKVRLTPMLR